MSVHGTLVATRSARSKVHVAIEETNGGIRTACGQVLPVGNRAEVTDDRRQRCGRCEIHHEANPDRKQFTRGAYVTTAGLRRF